MKNHLDRVATAAKAAVQSEGPRIIRERPPSRSHREPPSLVMDRPVIETTTVGAGFSEDHWANSHYYGTLKRFSGGSPFGGGHYAVLGITALDETARHYWRDFQQIKNLLLGDEWEGLELYPSESRLIDPSNRFYLWCFPPGSVPWGLPGGRRVCAPKDSPAAQRPFGGPMNG